MHEIIKKGRDFRIIPENFESATIFELKNADDNNTIYVAARDDNGNLIKFELGGGTASPTWYLTWFKLSDLTLVEK